MKRLHMMMILVVLVFVSIFLGHLFAGRRGSHIGAAIGVTLAGAMLWKIAPMEYLRQLGIIERTGAKLTNPEAFRARFIKGARLPAVVLIVVGLAALVVIFIVSN